MNVFKALAKGFKAISEEMQKPESFSKGEEFEDYLRKYTFPKDRYDLIHKTHTYQTNKEDFSESSLYPDYKFRCKETSKEFYVEAKFREGKYYQNKIEWCKPFQLKRYKEIDKTEAPVFLALGIGDSPNKLGEIFIIPLAKIEFNAFYDSFLGKYSFYVGKPIFAKHLWKL